MNHRDYPARMLLGAEGIPTPNPIGSSSPKTTLTLVRGLRASLRNKERGFLPIEAGDTLKAFVDRYRLMVDGHRYDWRKYRHMIPIYEDNHPEIVLQAGAQSGKTAFLLALFLRCGILRYGNLLGWYFPDQHLPTEYSKKRFAPLVTSSDELAPWLGADPEEEAKKKAAGRRAKVATDAVKSRTFGRSTFYFLTIGGRSSTEGLPMPVVFFDELRRMAAGDVQRAMERYSAQEQPIDVKASTPLLPDSDINAWFRRGNQSYFHTNCNCPDGIVLSLTFPDCLVSLKSATPALKAKVSHAFSHAGLPYLGMNDEERHRYGEAVYICPKCGDIIVDPREGWWEAHNPGAYAHSYQMPQILGWAAGRAMAKWNLQDTMPIERQEVYNSMLGITYLDPTASLITLEHLKAAASTRFRWAAKMLEREFDELYKWTSMGVDVQAGYLVVCIKAWAPDGKHRTIHLEVVEPRKSADPKNDDEGDPWKPLARIMERFKVRIALIDAQPEFSAAQRFAKLFEGRVWLVYYNETKTSPLVDWKDRAKAPKGQKGSENKFKYIVFPNKTKMLDWSISRWKNGHNETPPPDDLQDVLPYNGERVQFLSFLRGERHMVSPCRAAYWPHLLGIVFVKTKDPLTGEYQVKAENLGTIDPHFAHADAWASLGLDRMGHPRRGRAPHPEDPEPSS